MMNTTNCTTDVAHCTNCGSANLEDVTTGDQGYSACCNEPIAAGPCADRHPDVYGEAIRNYGSRSKGTEAHWFSDTVTLDEPKPRAKRQSHTDAGLTDHPKMSHANCSHESTPAARRACRASRKA